MSTHSEAPAVTAPARLALDPRVAVLVRRDGTVQLGWDPEHSLLVTPPAGCTADSLLRLFDSFDGNHSRPQIVWRAVESGFDAADVSALIAELSEHGLVCVRTEHRSRVGAIRVHGRGPLADAISAGLDRTRVVSSRSANYPAEADVRRWRADIVVLADDLVPDPRLTADLVAAAIPHLQVRIRDGRGVVGPFVVPGHTSCLRCADLARCGRDAEWPHLAAQLLGRVGNATPPTVLATAALALAQLESAIGGPPHPPPASLDATIEIDLHTGRLRKRRWDRHQLCDCWQPALRTATRRSGRS